MSSSASEAKARQRRIKNVTRQVIHKAYFQRIKDELRAEERRKVREERERQEESLREEAVRNAIEAIQREEARHRAEYKDKAVLLCSLFLSVVYFFLLCSFFLDEERE
jgi:hypothetical protein